jgi:hypothetical protein
MAFHPLDKYGALHLLHQIPQLQFLLCENSLAEIAIWRPNLNGRRFFQQLEIKGSRALGRSRPRQEPRMEIT